MGWSVTCGVRWPLNTILSRRAEAARVDFTHRKGSTAGERGVLRFE